MTGFARIDNSPISVVNSVPLNERGLAVHTFFQALPEVEILIDQFWQIEGQIDERMHDEANWPY